MQYYDYKTDSFVNISFEENKLRGVIDIIQLGDGSLLAIVSGRGIYRIDKNKKCIVYDNELNSLCKLGTLSCMYEDSSQGKLWIGTSNNGLLCINLTDKAVNTYKKPILLSDRVSDIVSDYDGDLFISTDKGISVFNELEGGFVRIPFEDNLSYDIRDMIRASDGKIYVATFNNGVYVVDKKEHKIFSANLCSTELDMSKARVVSLYCDRDSNLWVGCFQEGFVCSSVKDMDFHSWSHPNMFGRSGYGISAIRKTRDGKTWVGVEGMGVACLDDDYSIISNVLPGRTIVSVFEDSEGGLWLGDYYDGIRFLDRSNGKVRTVSGIIGRVKSIVEDSDGYLYISCFGHGLKRYDRKNGKILDILEITSNTHGLKNKWINILMIDSRQRLWIGHYKGVDCYDIKKGEFISLPSDSAMNYSICYSLAEDSKNNVWIGTNKGLFCVDNNKVRRFTVKEGLANDVVCGVTEDSDGNIWCSTFGGLSRLGADKSIKNYFLSSGLANQEFVRGVYDNGGKMLFFGAGNKLIYFVPDEVESASYSRSPLITRLTVDNEAVNLSTQKGGRTIIDDELILSEEFFFSNNTNSFSFDFSTMDYGSTNNIYYEYRIKELSDEFLSTLPGIPTVTFNHLPYGDYTMEVRACLGNSHSPLKKWTLHIAYPWYLSWYGIFAYVIVLLLVGWRIWYSQRRKRINRMNEEKLKIFMNIVHDVRSPLTMIINPLENLLRDCCELTYRKPLLTMQKNTRRILKLVEQMLDLSRLDKGQLEMNLVPTDLSIYIEEVCQSFDYLSEERNINLQFIHEKDGPVMAFIDPDYFDKIIVNLISNAFKYTSDGGEISVSLSSVNNMATIKVVDSGTGIDESDLKRIFERFYQAKGASFGYGIGLNLASMLVEKHNGKISASNRTDRSGSCFTVSVPLVSEKNQNVLSVGVQAENLLYKKTVSDEKDTVTENLKCVRTKTNYRVLFADDDKDLCSYISSELSSEYRVKVVNDGAEALEEILTTIPDLVITDLCMPEIDGIELVKSIKKNINTNHIPVVLLTTRASRENYMKSLEVKADAFIAKPFVIDELRMVISNLLANRHILKGKFSGVQEQNGKLKNLEVKSNDDILMEHIMEIINKNMDNPELNVEFLAESVGVSRVQLYRKLKEITCISPAEFIRNIRMKQAARLLKEERINVSQVTYMVGFVNPTHFSTVFKKYYGMTPGDYVLHHKNLSRG